MNEWNDYIKERVRRRAYEPEHRSEEGAPAGRRDQRIVPTFQKTLDAQVAVLDMERVLSEKDRFLYNQVWREGRTHREIAESSGKSQHAVESAVRRLRERLAAV